MMLDDHKSAPPKLLASRTSNARWPRFPNNSTVMVGVELADPGSEVGIWVPVRRTIE